MAEDFVIEMLHITKEFPGIKANDDITLQLRKGEVHALLGENGAGKSTLMSVLFGLYQPEEGKILKNGKEVAIRNPNDANALGIGMVHQHFKLVECFSVLDNIILGVEPNKLGFLQKAEARKKVVALSEKYGLRVDPDALISDISVGMQQRVEILKMLYRDNEILIFDEPTAVLTPQEIDELMEIMRGFKKEGKSILFITHKLNEIMAVADRCTVLRKGKYMGTVDIKDTTKEELSRMMVGRDVQLQVDKKPAHPGDVVLDVEGVTIHNDQRKKDSVKDVTFQVHAGEIVCLAGIEGNGQTELVYGLTGLEKLSGGKITLDGKDITRESIRQRSKDGMSTSPKTATSTVWCWITASKTTWCSSATGSPSSRRAALSSPIRSASTPISSSLSTTSAAVRAAPPSCAACPAATSRRPSSPARSTKTPSCWWLFSPPAAWMSALSNTSTDRSSPSATRAKLSCWSASSWMRS